MKQFRSQCQHFVGQSLKIYTTTLKPKTLLATCWKSRLEAIRPLRYYIDEFYDALIDIPDDESVDTLKEMTLKHLSLNSEISFLFFYLVVWHCVFLIIFF